MKELEKFDRDINKTQIESVVKKQQQVEFKFIDTIRPQNGHILFEINEKDESIKIADHIIRKDLTWDQAIEVLNGELKIKEVVQRPGCVYISALNKESALKRYKTNRGSSIKEGKNEMKLL